MGWSGYELYDGDETQTCHYDFLKRAKIGKSKDERYEMLQLDGTIIPKNMRGLLRKNYKLILKKMVKPKFLTNKLGSDQLFEEDSAIEWQMLLSLFVDNKVKPPRIIKTNGIKATEYLMGNHASDFTEPALRRRVLRKFIAKAKIL